MSMLLDQPQRQDRTAQILGSLRTIATLPEVTSRITAIINNPQSTAADLHRIIAHDPALVARLLRLVNSAFYSRTATIDSVERAIVLLGFKAVHHLAIAATMERMFPNVKLCEGFTARDLWTHSTAVAVVAREMARVVCRPIAEETFLAGLMHDVGLLAMLQACPRELRQVCELAKTEPTPWGVLELGIIGADHQELGAALASHWRFPAICREVTAHHHCPSRAPEQHRMAASIIHVADTLCSQERVGFHLTASTQLPDEAAFQLLPSGLIEATKAHLHEQVLSAVQIFA